MIVATKCIKTFKSRYSSHASSLTFNALSRVQNLEVLAATTLENCLSNNICYLQMSSENCSKLFRQTKQLFTQTNQVCQQVFGHFCHINCTLYNWICISEAMM